MYEAGLSVEAFKVVDEGRRAWQGGVLRPPVRAPVSDRAVNRQVRVVLGTGGVCLDVGRERLARGLRPAPEPGVGVRMLPGLATASGGVSAARLSTMSRAVGLGGGGHDEAAGAAVGGLRGPAWGARSEETRLNSSHRL